jgi:multidrug efflux system membrane fusion protein
MRSFSLACALGLLILVGLMSGCHNNPVKPPPPKPAEVLVSPAVEKEFVDYEDFTGRLEAFKKVDIQSRVTGFLSKVNFREGSKVSKDAVLFEIDPRPYKADLDKAEASIVQAQARLTRLEGDLTRAQELFRRQSLGKEEFEKVRGDHAEALAAQKVAEAGRTSAKLFYDYTKVTSPIDGVVGRALVDEGNLVKADGTILTTVVTQDPIYAYFDVDERTLLRLRRLVRDGKIQATGASTLPVRMGLADEDDFPQAGTIDFEDNAVDPNTGTLRLRGVFKNQQGFLAPGMFVRIRFQVGLPRTGTLVPEQGVGTDQGQKFVYVVGDKNKVEYRKVKTGALVKEERVIEEGIKPGERIIVSGLQRVRPNAEVVPKLVGGPPEVAKAHEPPKAIMNSNGTK